MFPKRYNSLGPLTTPMLLLRQVAAVLTVLANYFLALRDYPRPTADWILAAATTPMMAATIFTTWFHRRSLRHFWQLVSVVGSAACLQRGMQEGESARMASTVLGDFARTEAQAQGIRSGLRLLSLLVVGLGLLATALLARSSPLRAQ